jgi:hypothetical protein
VPLSAVCWRRLLIPLLSYHTITINSDSISKSRTSCTMTQTPESCRRPLWTFETPSPLHSGSTSCENSQQGAQAYRRMSHQRTMSGLVGVLEQVSELTMEDDQCENETPLRTPDPFKQLAMRRLPTLEDAMKHNPSAFLTCGQQYRNCAPPAHKLMTAPPLPSSPELSLGAEGLPIPPQFSPLGSSHQIEIPAVMRLSDSDDDDMMISPAGFLPLAPPPTPTYTPLPPQMPYMETPEPVARKKIGVNSLQMRKGPFSFR